jgi:phosphoserine aminotransferase
MLADQVEWMNDNGGLGFTTGRTRQSSRHLYAWAEAHELADAVRGRPGQALARHRDDRLRRGGRRRGPGEDPPRQRILDVEPYRKLGRNQLRIGMFPAVEPADVQALTACIDYVLEQR